MEPPKTWRSTRSGKAFSPFLPGAIHGPLQPIVCGQSVDFTALLRQSMDVEADLLQQERYGTQVTSPLPATTAAAYTECSPASTFETLPAASSDPPQKPPAARPGPHPKLPPSAPSISCNHARRKRKRADAADHGGLETRDEVLDKFVRAPAATIPVTVNFADFPATGGAYSAKNETKDHAWVEYSRDELLQQWGFELIEWDGFTYFPIVDSDGRIIAVLVGQPRDERYKQSADAVFDLLTEERETAVFDDHETQHRRGNFPVLNVGVTHGTGTQAPVYLNNQRHAEMAERLLADTNVKRLAAFASASFRLWAPKVHKYYRDHLNALYIKMPHLRRIFPRSVYPTAAFNFGPHVRTFKHRDVLNCPFGWCAIQALGRFDPKKGGHLVLWELKLVIEFPPGALVLIPSATITHSNVAVAEGDVRASFTQYCAGGLFRYVDYGFRKEAELKAQDPALYAEMCQVRGDRWEMGLGLLSRLQDFVKT